MDFHRESFFNPDMAHAFNIWIPVRNVSCENAIRYVPESQLTPEEDIKTVNEGSGLRGVERFGTGHKIGLLYDRKTIVGGVDFSTVERMVVPEGSYSVFDANLIHGGGENRIDRIRFSLDFRVIPTEKVSHKAFNFAAAGEYFVRRD